MSVRAVLVCALLALDNAQRRDQLLWVLPDRVEGPKDDYPEMLLQLAG